MRSGASADTKPSRPAGRNGKPRAAGKPSAPAQPGGNGEVEVRRVSWFACHRSDDALELAKANPNAFVLLFVVAFRAQWKDGFNRFGLQPGEALLGDFRECGMSRQQYRTALRQLVKWHFLTVKVTTKGTVARLVNSRVFSLSPVAGNQQANQQPTIGQPSANHYLQGYTADTATLGQERTGFSSDSKPPRSPRRKFRQFVPRPTTFEEVVAHFQFLGTEHETAVERASRFITVNNAGGWAIDGKPIVDWRNAAEGFNASCENTGP